TNYKIYGGNASGSETLLYTTPTLNVTPTYDNAGLWWNQLRSYKVTAVSNGAESNSSAVTITTWDRPGTPAVTATGGVASVVLTWTAPANGGTALTGYHVYASSSSGAETSLAWVNSTNGATT